MFLLILIFHFFARIACAQTQNGSEILQLAEQQLPKCALNCMLNTVGESTCELADVQCIKSNTSFQDSLAKCTTASCNVREALTTKKFLQELMGAPVRDHTKLGALTSLIVGGAAVVFCILRIIARQPKLRGTWGIDDWFMIAAILCVIPVTICVYLLTRYGMGLDIWQVPFDNITRTLKIFYFVELFYVAATGLTKVSMLLFYLRIFPRTGLRNAILVTTAFCVAYMITFILAVALQCIPIRNAWEGWDGRRGRCINLNAVAWAAAVVNIVLDLVVIVLPIRELHKLVMDRRQKLGIIFMFLGGLFVTVVSMLRLKFLIQFQTTQNITWDYLPVAYWSAVEADVGVMVACLPAIRSLAVFVHNRLVKKPASNTSYYEAKSGSNRPSRKNSQSYILGSRVANRADMQDFMRLEEYEMQAGADAKDGASSLALSEDSPAQVLRPQESALPAAYPVAHTFREQPMGGITVKSEFHVDVATP